MFTKNSKVSLYNFKPMKIKVLSQQ